VNGNTSPVTATVNANLEENGAEIQIVNIGSNAVSFVSDTNLSLPTTVTLAGGGSNSTSFTYNSVLGKFVQPASSAAYSPPQILSPILFGANASGFTPASLVSHATTQGGGGGTTSAINTTGANFIALQIISLGTCSSVTDSASNSWSAVTPTFSTGVSGASEYIAYKVSPTTSSSHTFTISCSSYSILFVLAFSNGPTTGYDSTAGYGTVSSNTSATTATLSSITPSANHELLITFGVFTGITLASASVNDSFSTVVDLTANSANSWYQQGTAAAIAPAWTWSPSSPYGIYIAAFK